MRVVAVVAVIGIHVSGIAVMRYGQLDPYSWWSADVFDSLCRWAVPVFIMLSGALNLDPRRTEPPSAFYRARIVRVGVPLLAWAAFYFWWTSAFYGEQVSRAFVLSALLDGLTYNHLYFLFLLLGLYAVTPLLRVYVTTTGRATQWMVALFLLVFVSCGFPQSTIPMNAFTRFIPFIGYFLVGSLLRDVLLRTTVVAAAFLGFSVTTAMIAIGTGKRFADWGPGDWRSLGLYDALGPAVIVQSIAAFILLRACCTERRAVAPRRHRPMHVFAPLVFGIYVVHRAVHDLLSAYARAQLPQDPVVAMLIQVTLAFLISAAVVASIRRVPYLRRVVG